MASPRSHRRSLFNNSRPDDSGALAMSLWSREGAHCRNKACHWSGPSLLHVTTIPPSGVCLLRYVEHSIPTPEVSSVPLAQGVTPPPCCSDPYCPHALPALLDLLLLPEFDMPLSITQFAPLLLSVSSSGMPVERGLGWPSVLFPTVSPESRTKAGRCPESAGETLAGSCEQCLKEQMEGGSGEGLVPRGWWVCVLSHAGVLSDHTQFLSSNLM